MVLLWNSEKMGDTALKYDFIEMKNERKLIEKVEGDLQCFLKLEDKQTIVGFDRY